MYKSFSRNYQSTKRMEMNISSKFNFHICILPFKKVRKDHSFFLDFLKQANFELLCCTFFSSFPDFKKIDITKEYLHLIKVWHRATVVRTA